MTSVKEGTNFQEITIAAAGLQSAPEEVLVVIDPVHQEIPDFVPQEGPVFLAPDVKTEKGEEKQNAPAESTADKLMDQYRRIGEAQNHQYGGGGAGAPAPNFNKPPAPAKKATAPASVAPPKP